MNYLIGKKIERVFISKNGNDQMVFITDQNERILYSAEGDCCSYSYFQDLIGVKNLLGHTIESVESIDLEHDGWTNHDENKSYGYIIRTDNGVCVLSFRNASNGYYGGWLQREIGDFKLDMDEILNDWIAD